MKILSLFFALFLLTACGSDYGNEVRGGNLTVYFLNADDQQLAEKIARFWKENELLTDKKQDLQLTKTGDWYALHIIANEPKIVKDMPFDERRILLGLQSELQSELGVNNFQLIVCNSSFEPIYNINE